MTGFPLTVIAFLDGLASASPDKRLLPSLTVDEEILKAELAFEWGVRAVERTDDGGDGSRARMER